MTYFSLLSFVGAGFSAGLAILVLYRDRRPLVHRIFIAGMLILFLEAALGGIGYWVKTSAEVMKWQHIRLMATAVMPGIWLLFTFIYARASDQSFVRKYKGIIYAVFVLPLILVTTFWRSFFVGDPIQVTSSSWLIRLGWSGYAFQLYLLICYVFLLMNLEKILRESAGHIRWQVKFMVLGLGCLFAIRIYTGSQSILFHSLDTELGVINSGVLVIANVLILKSLIRAKVLNVDFYFSHSLIYNSFTLFVVGIYFLAVGGLAKVISHFGWDASLYFNSFMIFLAILGISILLLSDRLRNRIKRFIGTHLKRPFYDYRRVWAEFTEATTSLTQVKDLCSAVVKKISKIFETLSVTIWLLDEKEESLFLGGSTVFTDRQAKNIKLLKIDGPSFIHAIRNQHAPVDVEHAKESWVLEFKERYLNHLREARMRYYVPLTSGGSFLGVLALDDRVGDMPLTLVDFDLLKTIADQTASILLNLRLSEHLRQVKEVEAFQTMSAFMMHDLKNLASSLSLTIQNLPTHFDNQEFRKDALQIMHQSVTKINRMCNQLSLLSKGIELKRTETDLNDLVRGSILGLRGSANVTLNSDLRPLPRLMIDPEQVQNVMTNLILNANEAVGSEGDIRVATEQRDGWAVLWVIDNGCGMSKEFIEQSLFRPFKTSKKQGMGIGLFHSKMIVEAHQGHIEVESEEGKGTTFRVLLPLGR
jgi:putative PEP-CTERM system histidine kinase